MLLTGNHIHGKLDSVANNRQTLKMNAIGLNQAT